MTVFSTRYDIGTVGCRAMREIAMSGWLTEEPTGSGYIATGIWIPVSWLKAAPTDEPSGRDEGSLRRRAAALATETPYVSAAAPVRPALSGNLAEDVHLVCGLTWRQIADVFGISERAVAGWRSQGVPRHRAQTMEALRAIGATLVGGLGAEGVHEWLTRGEPSRLERLRDGEVESVAVEAHSYQDTPAT